MGEKMKKIMKKLLISICIIFSIFNIFGNIGGINLNEVNAAGAISEAEADSFDVVNLAGSLFDGFVGLQTTGLKLAIFAVANVIKGLTSLIALVGGTGVWDIGDIIFADRAGNNSTAIFSIDFFNIDGISNGTVKALRQSVAGWYYSFRNLAIVALLLILVYVGIRMALASVGEEEAKYKKMLIDWFTSLVLVFVMHYLMVFIIELNKVLVNVLFEAMVNDPSTHSNGIFSLFGIDVGDWAPWNRYMVDLAYDVFHIKFTVGWGALLVYCIMIGVTIMFMFMYIKRMTTVGFLIMISPLITITYSIDKMKDGKSQALDTWLKEFTYNILINPFHCIIYIVFASTAINLLNSNDSRTMGSAVFAIMMILFIYKAEDIVKKIFNFQSSSLTNVVASAAAITTGIGIMKNIAGKSASKVPNASDIPDFDINKDNKDVQIGDVKSNITRQSQQASQNTEAANNVQQLDTPNDAQSQQMSNANDSAQYNDNYEDQKQTIKAPSRMKKLYKRAGNYIQDNGTRIITRAIGGTVFGAIGLATGSYPRFHKWAYGWRTCG